VNVRPIRSQLQRNEISERASGIPPRGFLGARGPEFWGAIVTLLVLGLMGLIFWLVVGP
jgi:hypothetical protein